MHNYFFFHSSSRVDALLESLQCFCVLWALFTYTLGFAWLGSSLLCYCV